MSVKLVSSINETGWEKIDTKGNPFLSFDFFHSLEEGKSIGEGTGWSPLYFTNPGKSVLFSFIKEHSYGEYIFDWDWANFYHEHNIAYYPKLTSMIPFSSVTTSHFVGDEAHELMKSYESYYNQNSFSSSHFLFLTKNELSFFESYDYIIRDSFQYHFENNNYKSFNDFLISLKSKKAKQIRKERTFETSIKFNKFTGEALSLAHAEEMYHFYLSTINNKQAIPYLTKVFFLQAFEKLRHSIYYIQATKDDVAFAGALFFYSRDRLYGRYWGASEDVSNIHFELCYYQGIEICIEKKISVFEAGAQGEHKISRGFKPVKTYSAHKFKHPQFQKAIADYIQKERENIDSVMTLLSMRLPFK